MKNKEFVKMKIYTDMDSYNRAVREAESRIKAVQVALEWGEKHIAIDKVDRKKFLIDVVEEFNRQLEIQKGDIVKQKIAVEKLHFLLDVHVSELVAIQQQYERFEAPIYVKDEDIVSGVSQEDFIKYTSTIEENERLIKANNLIDALSQIEKYVKVYPQDICRGSSNFVRYDLRENKYIVNM